MLRHRPSSLLHSCLLAIAMLSYTAPLVAQGGSSQPLPKQKPASPVFKTVVRRVIVDVTVQDSNGNPVHGLSAKDFFVSEDGRPQRILSFDAYDLDAPSISLPPNAPAQPTNTFVNIPTAPERGPLYVILYDMVNMDEDDQITARQQVLKFISSKPAGTRIAIYANSDGLHFIQGFTDDKDLLFAAFDPQHPVPHIPRSFLFARNYGRGDTISTMSILTHIAQFLEGLPGRKNLIWMAGMFPIALYPHEGDPEDLRDDIKRELDALTRAQVAIYPVNIRGVVTNPEGALTGLTPFSGSASVEPLPGGTAPGGVAAASGTVPGGTPDRSTANLQTGGRLQDSGVSGSLATGYMVENDLAAATGGQAFHSANDLKAALTEAAEYGGNYYSLSYAPTNPTYNGTLRTISIRLSKPGYRLAYRRSYYADDPNAPMRSEKGKSESDKDIPEQAAVQSQERPLYAGLQHGAPLLHQLIFKVRVHAVGGLTPATAEQIEKLAHQPAYTRAKNKPSAKLAANVQIQKYAIYYLVTAGQIKHTKDGSLPLEFAAVAFNSDGAVVNGVFEQASPENSSNLWPDEQSPEDHSKSRDRGQRRVYRAMQELDVPTGAVSIRVAVRDISSDRVGAMEIRLPLVPEKENSEPHPQPVSSGTVSPN